MLESYVSEQAGRVIGELLKVACVGDALLEYCETQEQ